MYEKILNKINEFENIAIFRHAKPDGDCMFSSMALYYFLKDNFNKKIKLGGFDKFDLLSKNDKISDNFIQNALIFVLDTATDNRIDDFRAMAGKYIIKIDHHPGNNDFGDLNIVNPECSSTCELLADIFLSKKFKDFKYSDKVYEYLYSGIVTDTLNFRTTNVTANTLLIASKIIEKGNFKPSNIVEKIMDINLSNYYKINEIRKNLVVEDKFGYIKLNSKQIKKLEMDSNQAKNNIDVIGNIKEFNIWAFAVENNGKWDCSIRSKRQYIINNVAAKYRGGGHPNAAAVKQLTNIEINNLFNELIKMSRKK